MHAVCASYSLETRANDSQPTDGFICREAEVFDEINGDKRSRASESGFAVYLWERVMQETEGMVG